MTNTSNPNDIITAQALPLEDIITPDSVSAWPPALGWYIVFAIVIALIIAGISFYRHYIKKWGYRKEAIADIDSIMADWYEHRKTRKQASQQLLQVLKQTAMTAYPHHELEKRYGKDWLNALEQQAPNIQIDNTIADFICHEQYQHESSSDPEMIYQFCLYWIKKHQKNWQAEIKTASSNLNGGSAC